MKDIFFVLLVGYNAVCFRPDYSKLPLIIAAFSVVVVAWVFATVQDVILDMDATIALVKSLTPMVLLLWIREYDLLQLARVPVVIASLLVVTLFWIITIVPATEGPIYFFFNTMGNDTIMMSWRSFLGIELFTMYYKSIVSFILIFAVFISVSFNPEKRNWRIILSMLIVLHAFVISGTRSTMLLPFFLFGMIAYREYKDARYFKYILYPLIFILGVAFVVLLFMLIMEKDESSNIIKYAHLYSYWELFREHPQYLLFGQGPGSAFYSSGFLRVTTVTEWTYIELIRYFGIFSLVIVYAFFRPLVRMWKDRGDNLSYALFWAYLAYLAIAGTNPLLLSSTGMLVLLIAYSYEEKLKRKERCIQSQY
ncbi:MAG: ligase [Bacteroidaceae bacterium]|nr:ligase [Bacteroidaceae bacterium]